MVKLTVKLGELSSLFIVYNITIFYFIRCIVFDFIFYCVTVHTLYKGLLFGSMTMAVVELCEPDKQMVKLTV